MITFNVNDELTINCPTKSDDITTKFLSDLANEVYVAPEYILVGLIQSARIAELAYGANGKNKNVVTTVLPVYIKAGKTDNELVNSLTLKDKLHISKSNIELGEHVRLANNILTLQTLMQYFAIDDQLRREVITGKFFTDRNIDKDTRAFAVEFKIVPVSDIHGFFKNIDMDNPYVKKIEK